MNQLAWLIILAQSLMPQVKPPTPLEIHLRARSGMVAPMIMVNPCQDQGIVYGYICEPGKCGWDEPKYESNKYPKRTVIIRGETSSRERHQ